MNLHHLPCTAAIAAAWLMTAAPAAPAAVTYPGTGKDIAYAIHVEGQGTYQYAERSGPDDSWNGADGTMSFTYAGDLNDGVVFRDTSPLEAKGDDLPSGTADGTYVSTSSSGSQPACTPEAGWAPVQGWMRVADDASVSLTVPLDGTEDIWIRPFEQIVLQFTCPGEVSHPTLSAGAWAVNDGGAFDEHGNVKWGANPFDFTFNLPKDIVGMGYIEQLIPKHVVDGASCPGYVNEQTTTCHLEWTATVQLRKLWAKATPTPDEDLLVPLVPQGKASLSKDASKASFSVSCPGGCSGSATLTPGGGAKASAVKAGKPLARVSFKVAKGQAKRVTLKLGAKARRAVRRAGGAGIVVRVTSGSRTTTKTLRLRLLRRR